MRNRSKYFVIQLNLSNTDTKGKICPEIQAEGGHDDRYH